VTAVITDQESVAPTQSVPIVCEAPDDELLLIDWLNALVYELACGRSCSANSTFASMTRDSEIGIGEGFALS
jgi:SHS2 domain-containing protein